MLLQMRIRNLGVIEDAVLELSPGLNVLTGETGAGKTMVVSGLGLLLGARADSGMVRTGADSAGVEGVLDVAPDHPARRRIEEAGGDASEDLILARTVTGQGRSRAYVGGRSAPVTVLGELGEMLVAVHGQADQWRLRKPDQHRAMLDDTGGPELAAAARAYREVFEEHAAVSAELRRVGELERDRAIESDVLRASLEEIERVDPLAGEDDELRTEDERLANADDLRSASAQAHTLVMGGETGEGGVVDRISAARAALQVGAGHDPDLDALCARVAELGYLAADVGADLAAYLAGVDADPLRLAAVQERRAELGRLHRKYGDTNAEVLAWGARAAARLTELDGAHDRAGELEARRAELETRLEQVAADLTAARRVAAELLGAQVTAELAHLAMGKAVVEVSVQPGERLGPHGADDVEIRLAANPGAPARSVAKAASGGELSRVMLALEVVTAAPHAAHEADGGAAAVPTFVFDEVDAGVGGRAALDIGARLAALAEHAQVVVVTHLAQVAAFADRHLVVHKADDGGVTASGVHIVEDDERRAELARMMAGGDSPVALQHASELLDEASRRSSRGPGRGAHDDAPAMT